MNGNFLSLSLNLESENHVLSGILPPHKQTKNKEELRDEMSARGLFYDSPAHFLLEVFLLKPIKMEMG
jgi:hypothetical protein